MDNRKAVLGLGAGAVVLAALVVVLVLVLTHHSTATNAKTTPSPTPTLTLTPSISPPTPSPTSAAPTSPVPPPATKGASPPASPAGTGNGMVESSYGFMYPASWSLSRLVVRTAVATTATATAPSGPGRLDYLADTSPTAYYPDHTVDHVGIEAAIISLFPSCTKFASLTVVPNKGFVYTCAPATAGGQPVNVRGTVLVAPYPKGFRVLQVVLPAAEDAEATAILNSFH